MTLAERRSAASPAAGPTPAQAAHHVWLLSDPQRELTVTQSAEHAALPDHTFSVSETRLSS